MNISSQNQKEVLQSLADETSPVAVDTETTGLKRYHQDRLFSIVTASKSSEQYFNYNEVTGGDFMKAPDTEGFNNALSKAPCIFMQNAKFDLAMLRKEGVEVLAPIHDCMVAGRLIDNNHFSYSLDAMAKRDLGKEKDDRVKAYCDEHRLYRQVHRPGKKKPDKEYFYHMVPVDIMAEYAGTDARLTYDLGEWQRNKIREMSGVKNFFGHCLNDIYLLERDITKVTFEMEWNGILIDKEYCREAAEFETARYQGYQAQIEAQTGAAFVDSGEHLAPFLQAQGFELEMGKDGSPKVDEDALSGMDSQLARDVLGYREAYKRANTYFLALLQHADKNSRVHPNLKQAGTKTGRFSCEEPNLQNQPKDESDVKYPVRRAFIPSPGYFFFAPDYDQMEFRMMLDYAGEMGLIRDILNDFDPHQATADRIRHPRKVAKTINFGLMYGMGLPALAKKLGVRKSVAKDIRADYFDALPKVRDLIQTIQKRAELNKYIMTWHGRIARFPDPKFSYRAPNSVIQGGSADAVKLAMKRCHEFLQGKKSRMLLQIHDELLFEVHYSEWEICDELMRIMQATFPSTHLPLTVSPAYSLKSWGEIIEGHPREHFGKEGRDQVQGTHQAAVGGAP